MNSIPEPADLEIPLLGKHLLDVVVLSTIPAFLILLHFLLPTHIQERLVFAFHDPDPVTAWTAAYFHTDEMHLLANVSGYFVAILPVYFLYNHRRRRRQFWLTVGTILLLTPLVTALVDYYLLHLRWELMAEGATSRGFSAIVTGFGGMLLAAVGLFLSHEYDAYRATNASMLFVLVGFLLVGQGLGAVSPVIVVLLIVGFLGIGLALIPRAAISNPDRGAEMLGEHARNILYALVGGVFAAAFMLTFVPSGGEGGTFSNIIAHMTGFAFGLVVAFVVSIGTNRW